MRLFASLGAVTALVSSLSAVGCNQTTSPTSPTSVNYGQPSAGSPQVTTLNSSSSLGASPSTIVVTIPVSFTIQPAAKAGIQACVGETVTFVGNTNVVAHQTTLPDGSTSLDLLHFNGKGAVAVGGSTGETYRLVGADSNPIVWAPSGALTATFDANLLAIGSGSAKSFMAHIQEHITITPAGEITALVDFLSIECR